MRLAFFGSSRLSCIILARLLASEHQIVAVVTQPDQPAGRRMELSPTPVCMDAATAGLPVLKPERLRGNTELLEQLREFNLDALVVASYGQIIPKSILELTPWPLNVHPSLLPKLRGASPIRTALLQGLKRTGCCIMRMTPRLDDGDLLACEELDIPPDWNHEQLETTLAELGGRLLLETLEQAGAGRADLEPQDHAQATYCSTYGRDDTWIDWSRSAAELHNFIRAWDPDIGALTLLDGKRLKIWRTEVARDAETDLLAAGGVLSANRTGVLIATGDGVLRVFELQPENKRRMDAAAFLAGNQIQPGTKFG